MRELVFRLDSLDPEASESLKVVAYFDTLIDGRVSVESLVRGAATLSGTTAGFRNKVRAVRVLASGHLGPSGEPVPAILRKFGIDDEVWLERDGPPHANDAMVLERLAIAITIAITQNPEGSPSRRAVEVLLQAPSEGAVDEAQRLSAVAKLRLDPGAKVRAVAMPTEHSTPSPWSRATLATPWGIVTAAIVGERQAIPTTGRAGIGELVTINELPRSWRTATIALRISDKRHPQPLAENLGSLLLLAELVDRGPVLPADVSTLDELNEIIWTAEALQSLADGESLRAIAAVAGLHHSSLQARLPALIRNLGYDPRTPLGRTRLFAALMLQRLVHARF